MTSIQHYVEYNITLLTYYVKSFSFESLVSADGAIFKFKCICWFQNDLHLAALSASVTVLNCSDQRIKVVFLKLISQHCKSKALLSAYVAPLVSVGFLPVSLNVASLEGKLKTLVQ